MSPLSVQVPFPVFQGRDGQPLENGYIWIGEPNLNPQTNPVVAYYDAALTIVAPQPLRTLNGYVSRAGTPAQIYVDGADFSILVQDSKGSMVYNFPNGTGISADACGITYNPPFAGAVAIPVCEKLAETISVKDFGAVGDGVTDDATAIQDAIDAIPAAGGTLSFENGKTYLTSASLVVAQKNHFAIQGNGATIQRGFAPAATLANTLEFLACSFVQVANLKVFGNSDLWGGLEAQSHNIAVYGCERVLFQNVSSTYSPCDCFYTDRFAATRHGVTPVGVLQTSSITFENCLADYGFRQGYSAISAKSITAINSSFNNTARGSAGGTSPQAGVDLESNVGGTQTPDQATFIGCRFINNLGAGLIADYRGKGVETINCLFEDNGSNGFRASAENTVARTCTFRRNGIAGDSPRAQVQTIDATTTVKTYSSWLFDNCLFESAIWGDYQSTEGIGATFRQCNFYGGANFAIRVSASATTRPLQGPITIDGVRIQGKTSDSAPSSPAYVMLGSLQVPISIKNLTLDQQITRLGNTTNGSTTVTSINNTVALQVGMGVSGSGIPVGATISAIDYRGYEITLSATATATASTVVLSFTPATPITTGLLLGTPTDLLEGVNINFVGTGWITKQLGLTNARYLERNKDDGVVNAAYNLTGSATYGPPSLVDGAGDTTTVTVTGAALGDFAQPSFSLALQGITTTAFVSAANTVSVRFQNETGGTIDLGSGTLRARVSKA